MPRTDWSLGVLLGGASRRMGQDKALLTVGTLTLLEHVLARCQSDKIETILSVGHKDREIPSGLSGITRVPDRETGGGPLFGIEALLSATTTTWLVVIPCDMPGLQHDHLTELLKPMDEGDSAIYETDGTQLVMPMVLRTAWAKSVLPQILNSGKRRIVDLLDQGQKTLVSRPKSEASIRAFHNINTQSEFQAFCDLDLG
ncbi:MAG: molybdopterin-guanine dinucleotide biosynthesis protein A [Planctomycetota bacterium]|jgi:molybdopterin-guanine dinucleotide biosynthesis protein A